MNSFDQRKEAILTKKDKSAKGSWDQRIAPLCDRINSLSDYYTTSSCSGKSVIMKEKTGKDGSYYIWESHELVELGDIKEELSRLSGKDIFKYKLDAPIVFVVCNNLESAKKLFSLAVFAGFKESGIKITNKLIGVEIKSGERIEFPIFGEKVLVDDNFLKRVVELTNNKRKSGWKKIEKLKKFLLD